VALGIVAPPWFSGPLEAAVGARACESMLQLATLLPPARALALGAVDELAPRGAVLRAAAEAAARYGAMPAAARDASKQLMRGALVARTIGTPALRAEDLARTWAYFRSPEVQAGLRVYLERLSARKR
jgi:enoyl-CoA hydratase/carnithine racemase